ncbi:MAG: DNA-deoxyinosine glycosylase [Pseudomonadota bacterium]
MPIYCFPPVETPESKLLILGSMPGKASLRAAQYYAHPRNLFWPIVTALLGASAERSYESRVELLKAGGIALWDVLASCTRETSLDADIEKSSIVTNDFVSFYRAHPKLTHVFFNGAAAAETYRKYVLRALPEEMMRLQYQRLPSTSPAHAALSYTQKLAMWECVTQVVNADRNTHNLGECSGTKLPSPARGRRVGDEGVCKEENQ